MPLLPKDRDRLIRYVDFMESELSDFPRFSKIDWTTYSGDRDLRRNLERWIENLVNRSIDVVKVLKMPASIFATDMSSRRPDVFCYVYC